MARELRTTRSFDRSFQQLPKTIREQTTAKLQLFQEDPSHPSLRVKRIRGSARIWEISITMNYRLTFEVNEEWMLLRRIGTHDVLKRP